MTSVGLDETLYLAIDYTYYSVKILQNMGKVACCKKKTHKVKLSFSFFNTSTRIFQRKYSFNYHAKHILRIHVSGRLNVLSVYNDEKFLSFWVLLLKMWCWTSFQTWIEVSFRSVSVFETFQTNSWNRLPYLPPTVASMTNHSSAMKWAFHIDACQTQFS